MAVIDIKISAPSNVRHGVATANKILFSQNQLLQRNLIDLYNKTRCFLLAICFDL